jgi:hypothetical protein
MNRLVWYVILILSLALPGCSYIGEYVEISKNKTVSEEYLNALNKWTREKTLYSQFETKVHISTTMKSEEFNSAYLSEYSRIYLVGNQEEEKHRTLLFDQSSNFREFVFYAYTPDKESNDFSKEHSIWKIFLVDQSGKRSEPVDIREIEKITPVTRGLFPYVNPYYGNFYSLKFPKNQGHESSEQCTLIFTGILGTVELVWKEGC